MTGLTRASVHVSFAAGLAQQPGPRIFIDALGRSEVGRCAESGRGNAFRHLLDKVPYPAWILRDLIDELVNLVVFDRAASGQNLRGVRGLFVEALTGLNEILEFALCFAYLGLCGSEFVGEALPEAAQVEDAGLLLTST